MDRRDRDDLCLEMHFAADLADADVVDRLQEALQQSSPRFAERLRVLAYERDRSAVPVRVSSPGALRAAVVAKGSERGPTYRALVRMSPPRHDRRFGHVIVRGDVRATYLSVSFDEYTPCRPSGDRWLFSNSIGARIGSARIGRTRRAEWIIGLVERLADDPRLLWAAAYLHSEFAARNLHDEVDGMWALGRDVRRSLPGLFWLNVFGPPYRDLIGPERLRDAPAERSRSLGHSHILMLYPEPETWATPEGVAAHGRALRAIGPQFFYDREYPERETVAPDFGLPPLEAGEPLRVMTTDGKNFTLLP